MVDLADDWKLPLAWLDENVDQLWATAYHKRQNGHPTDLSEDSQVASEVRNRDYMVEGSWVEQLERVLETVTHNGARDVAFKMVDVQSAMGTHSDNQAKNKASVISSLKQLGYEQRTIRPSPGAQGQKFYALKTAKKPRIAKFECGQWLTKEVTEVDWVSQMDTAIEVRKEARGQM